MARRLAAPQLCPLCEHRHPPGGRFCIPMWRPDLPEVPVPVLPVPPVTIDAGIGLNPPPPLP